MLNPVEVISDIDTTKLRIGWLLLLITAVWPGGMFIQKIELEIFGWPFFPFWMIIVAPALVISLYAIYAKAAIEQDKGVILTEGTGDDPDTDSTVEKEVTQ